MNFKISHEKSLELVSALLDDCYNMYGYRWCVEFLYDQGLSVEQIEWLGMGDPTDIKNVIEDYIEEDNSDK